MFTVVEMLCILVHAVLSLTGIDNTAVVVSACAVAGFLCAFSSNGRIQEIWSWVKVPVDLDIDVVCCL